MKLSISTKAFSSNDTDIALLNYKDKTIIRDTVVGLRYTNEPLKNFNIDSSDSINQIVNLLLLNFDSNNQIYKIDDFSLLVLDI